MLTTIRSTKIVISTIPWKAHRFAREVSILPASSFMQSHFFSDSIKNSAMLLCFTSGALG